MSAHLLAVAAPLGPHGPPVIGFVGRQPPSTRPRGGTRFLSDLGH